MGAGIPSISTNKAVQSGGGGMPSPPFAANSAVNGLSVDGVTGKIVLGNNAGGSLAQLLSDRDIPGNGFGLRLLGNVANGSLRFGDDVTVPVQWQTVDGQAGLTGEFRMTLDQSYINPDDNIRDAVLQWGYNQNGAGGRVDNTDAEIHLAIESHYIPFPGGDPQFEVHLESTGIDGSKARYFSLSGQIPSVGANSFWTVETMQWFSILNFVDAYALLNPTGFKLQPTAAGLTSTFEMNGALFPGGSNLKIVTNNNGTGDIEFINGDGVGRMHFQSAAHFDGYPASGYDFLFRSNSNTATQLFSIINHSNRAKLSVIENTGSVLVNKDTYAGDGDNTFALQVGGGISFEDSAAMLRARQTMADGAAAALGTLTNAPTAGNPTKWIPFDDNGTIRYFPAW